MEAPRDYGQDRELAKQFLRDFTYANEDGELVSKYGPTLTKLANREMLHMYIEMADVELFNQDLAKHIVNNTMRYAEIFYEALDQILPSYKTREPEVKDIMDVFIEQRLLIRERNLRSSQGLGAAGAGANTGGGVASQGRMTNIDIDGQYPPDLNRRAEIYFKPASLKSTPIREVKAENIGKLVTVRGIVTRATDVKPKITIVTYTCDQCGCETFQPVTGADFLPLSDCSSAACKANKTPGKVTMQTRGSKFVKYQELKVQENSDQVPTGHIPRTITISVHGELTRQCTPGDHISISGVFLPLERTGFRMRNAGLTADTYIETHYLARMNKTEDDELNTEPMSCEEAQKLIDESDGSFLNKLSSSIAPEIYGHEELKKALLLLLVGGVDKTPYGMRIRGNINICLMGDPGVAKSQLLSFIDRLATRSQYTTGRGSSGVGLTAAVLKDPITNEMVLEGGALVLADQGVCCIDEFDKMMDADRTAIHEVMEQQTVSIAKAGIMTTLNARVSILAAANPAYGRYDVNRTIEANLELPPALLSRFDLLWLIRDKPSPERDLNLAEHITRIHKNPGEEPPNEYDAIDMKTMRRYINLCKQKNPSVPVHLDEEYKKAYLNIRERKRWSSNGDALFTSPRSLLAILRLSTAFARLRLADEVELADLEAAVDLYNSSRESIEGDKGKKTSVVGRLHDILARMAKGPDTALKLEAVYETAAEEGLTQVQVEDALKKLDEFESICFEDDSVIVLSYH